MVLTHGLAGETGGLEVAGSRASEVGLVAGVDDAAVDRLHAVANVRQRAGDDNAHRVVDELLRDRVRQLAALDASERDLVLLILVNSLLVVELVMDFVVVVVHRDFLP
ncbi:hypothetical protein D3C87_1771970 [compost metagenome]